MTTHNRIVVPIAVGLAAAVHIALLFLPFRVALPETLQEPESEFLYIDAVMVETPPPAPVPIVESPVIDPPPVPVPLPVLEQLPSLEAVNEAVEIGEESEEVEVHRPVERPVRQDRDVAGESRTQRATTESPADASVTVEPQETVFIPFYRVEERPDFLYRAPLQYPVQANRQRIEGVVIIEADIDAQGRILGTRVVREAGFGFEEAAIEMLETSRFSPAIINGRAVAVRMRFTIEFKLN